MSVLDQYQAAGETSHHMADLVEQGFRLVIVHGNGPQVGLILLRSELARDILHEVPLESCVADTQGAIGFHIQQTLTNELRRRRIAKPVVSLVTQVVVDRHDPAFRRPTKPIGPFLSPEVAAFHRDKDGWDVREDAGRGWRRVVPSPKPMEIVELDVVRALLQRDIIVIAAGGGGIPVVREADGSLRGIPAVIDKDFTSCLLARQIGAEILLIATGIDKVAVNFGKPSQQFLDRMTLAEARQYMAEGHFPPGSMGPKMEAAIAFLENGGRQVIITKPENIGDAVRGKAGTYILP